MMAECDEITRTIRNLSLIMYICLVGLNYYWFYRMFSGLMKFFTKPSKSVKSEYGVKKD